MHMSLIQVTDLSFTYEGSSEPVFAHVSFQADTSWRLGLTGRNGRGKTTLLRILQGGLAYSGTVTADTVFDYFPFPVSDTSRVTAEILEELLGDDWEQWRLERELGKLQVSNEVLLRPFGTLSGGERTKVLLAALFLREGHFLLIDEPTNHLDAAGRRLVSRYLSGKKGFILVSHDRVFLDESIDHILVIGRTGIEVQRGNYSSWQENKRRRDAFELAENERLKKDIRRLQTAAAQSRGWADESEKLKIGSDPRKEKTFLGTRAYLGEKSRKMQQRRKNLERRQEQAMEEKKALLHEGEEVESLRLYPLSFHAQRLVTMKELSAGYGAAGGFSPMDSEAGFAPMGGEAGFSPVCGGVSLEIRRGVRVFLDGGNGCGKSTLLRLILQEAGVPDKAAARVQYRGELQVASGLRISYVSQDTSFLRGSLREYARACGVEERLLFALLRKLGFARGQLETPMESCSEGQKKKILIARSLCEQAHLYIWDEPLNYIDIDSRQQIEELILTFCPTMLLVEHDEAFRERIATERSIQI